MSPRVSVLIPCYNSARWVGDAVQSALDQTLGDLEVVVVDDGSNDESVEVIRRFEPRIRWETHPNQGSNPTRNRLLALARGEWVQFLDADDVLLPGKLETQLEAAGEADLVVSPVLRDSGATTHGGPGVDAWTRLFRAEMGITSANLWRRAAVERAGGWRPELRCCQEYDLMLRMLIGGAGVRFVDRPLARRRDVNPGGIQARNRALAQIVHADLVEQGLRHLESRGELSPARRRAAAVALFDRARALRGLGHAEGRTLERRALELEPCASALLAGETGAYRTLYAWGGLAWAEPFRSLEQRLGRRLRRAGRNVPDPQQGEA
jgi:glycosyltransferase involved in cell wall biosynthesis